MRLNREQRKLLNLSGIFLLVIVIFLVFIYNPKRVAMMKIKSVVDVTSTELKEIQKFLGADITLEQGVGILQERAALLKLKYIKQQDVSLALKELSDMANKTGVRIISTKPQAPVPFTGKGGGAVRYDSAVCMALPVQLVLEGKYENLSKYIYSLENSRRGIYTIDGFSIRKSQEIYPDVRMELRIELYVFAEK